MTDSGHPSQVAAGPDIDPDVRSTYGEVNIAYLLLADLVVGKTPPRLKKIARQTEAQFRETARDAWPGGNLAHWETLGRKMGLSTTAELPAPRALAEQIRAGRDIPKINAIVDAANVAAIRYETPVGAFDLDALTPPLRLRLAGEGDSFTPILSTETVSCLPGEIVYADSTGVFSRYCRDADFSKITDATRNALCVVDGTPEMPTSFLLQAAQGLAGLLADVGGAELKIDGPHIATVGAEAARSGKEST